MKKRMLILLGAVAIVTLSFTFNTVTKKSDEKHKIHSQSTEPAGGFVDNEIQK
jgi:hypothetical protein